MACEFSGRVRDAFIAAGCDAVSCDLLPSESPGGPHIQGDVIAHLGDGWDMMIAFPPCTHLAVSGARYFAAKRADGRQAQAVNFFFALARAPIPRICLENPVGIMSTLYRRPDQVLQPWQFGHPESKATCLWLHNLPYLQLTHREEDFFCAPVPPRNAATGRWDNQTASGQNKLTPSPERAKVRAVTYAGIAAAMAEQWGHLR